VTDPPHEFELVLPENWLPLDVTGEHRLRDEVNRLLAVGAERDPAYVEHRKLVERQLRAVLRSIRGERVAMAAVWVTVIDDLLPLFASMTVSVVDGGADFLDRYRERPGYRTARVHLPNAGDAIALRFTDRSTDHQAGITVSGAVFQWLIPLRRGERVAILTFVCPDTEQLLLDAYAELFGAIAESFSVPAEIDHALD